MGRTIRFMGRYSLQFSLIFTGMAAIVAAGCWFTGSRDGIFGTYAEVFFFMSVMFSTLAGINQNVYVNVSLSMGACRRWCFWAGELFCAANVLVLTSLSVLVQLATAPLPSEDEPWFTLDGKTWLLLLLTGMFFAQLGLLVARTESTFWRTAWVICLMLLSMAASIGIMAVGLLDLLTMPAWLPDVLFAALPAGTAAVAVFTYLRYRKAVVRI